MALRAVLLDLDETLISDAASTNAALWAAAADVCAGWGLDPTEVAAAVLGAAQPLWAVGPHSAYCHRIGISASEGLWASFALGDDADTAGLRAFAPGYRREAWREGLRAAAAGGAGRAAGTEDAGADDRADVVADVAERFVWERARRQTPFPETLPVLAALRVAGLRLVLVTNGDRDLQRRKAVGSGLAALFDHVVISGQVGIGKPEPGIFRHALALAGVGADEAVMVGDSPGRDIAGGAAAGVRTVWIDRFADGGGSEGGAGPAPWATLPDLRGLPALLRAR